MRQIVTVWLWFWWVKYIQLWLVRGYETDGSSTYNCGWCVAVRLMGQVHTTVVSAWLWDWWVKYIRLWLVRGCETDGSSTYDCGYCVAVRLMVIVWLWDWWLLCGCETDEWSSHGMVPSVSCGCGLTSGWRRNGASLLWPRLWVMTEYAVMWWVSYGCESGWWCDYGMVWRVSCGCKCGWWCENGVDEVLSGLHDPHRHYSQATVAR